MSSHEYYGILCKSDLIYTTTVESLVCEGQYSSETKFIFSWQLNFMGNQ
jgi:hypothetical protein